jgi:hypothetical protein
MNPEQASITGFEPHARARNHIAPAGHVVVDPSSSHDAARSLTSERISALHRSIDSTLTLAREPLTSEQIVERLRLQGRTDSDASIRSRIAERVQAGAVIVVDFEGITARGRKCRRFAPSRRGAA